MDIKIKCQDCGENVEVIELETWEIGDVVDCESCGAEHEVVNTDPFKVVLIDEEK